MNQTPGVPYLRQMTSADLGQVVAIEQKSFSDPWALSSFRDLFYHAEYTSALVLSEPARNLARPERIIGYLVLWYLDGEIHIVNVAVHPEYRGRGWGERMIRVALLLGRRWACMRFLLEVRRSNEIARRLYEKLGFQLVAKRKAYYRKPVEDALVLGFEGRPKDGEFPITMTAEALKRPGRNIEK